MCFVASAITAVLAVSLAWLPVVCENLNFLGAEQRRGHFTHPGILTFIAAPKVLQDILIDNDSEEIGNNRVLLHCRPLTHRKMQCKTVQVGNHKR